MNFAPYGIPIELYASDLVLFPVMGAIMLAVTLLGRANAIEAICRVCLQRLGSRRQIAVMLVALTLGLSPILTNDVVLLSVLPFALGFGRYFGRLMGRLVILLALAANIGCMVTPFGAPHNIFILSTFHLTPVMFLRAMWPLAVTGGAMVLLTAVVGFGGRGRVERVGLVRPNRLLTIQGLGLLAAAIATVLQVVSPWLLVGLCGVALVLGRERGKLVRGIDWLLLVTLFGMLIAGKLAVHYWPMKLGSEGAYLWSLALSQVISNVPAGLIVAPGAGAENWRAVAYGLNVGGIGTLIGSLATLIAYRMARRAGVEVGVHQFHLWNLGFFVALAVLAAGLLAVK